VARDSIGLAMPDQVDGMQLRRAVERQPPGCHLIQHDSEGEDIGTVVERSADRLLGAHIRDGAHHDARHRDGLARDVRVRACRSGPVMFGQPEIEDLDVAVRRDHHVVRLDVAVHDAVRVRGMQPVSDLNPDSDNLIKRDRCLRDSVSQRPAFDVLHRDVADASGITDFVDGGDVGMGKRGGRARLVREAPPPISIELEFGREDLQGDPPVEPGVGGEEHFAHAAGPDCRHDFVEPESGAAGEGHERDGKYSGRDSRQGGIPCP